MNITIVSDVLKEEDNGTSIATMNLVRYLKSQNHNVTILCADSSKKGKDGYVIVPELGILGFNWLIKKNNVVFAQPQKKLIMKAIKYADVVHIMVPFFLGCKTARMAEENGIPVTAGFHMQAENFSCQLKLHNNRAFNKFIYKTIYNSLYKHCSAIHYPTQFIKDTFEKAINVSTPAHIISNGVNSHIIKKHIDKPSNLKDKYVILTTGRYSREKDQKTLLLAMKYSKYRYKIQLILAGQGPIEKKLKRIAKRLRIAPIFKFFSRTEIANVLNYADLYVHPAEIELEGIACIEAISCGKCTIVSDSPRSATRFFVSNDKVVFKHNNPKDLARVIDYFIEHPEEKKIIEMENFNNADKYDQTHCMEEMEKMLQGAINEKK